MQNLLKAPNDTCDCPKCQGNPLVDVSDLTPEEEAAKESGLQIAREYDAKANALLDEASIKLASIRAEARGILRPQADKIWYGIRTRLGVDPATPMEFRNGRILMRREDAIKAGLYPPQPSEVSPAEPPAPVATP